MSQGFGREMPSPHVQGVHRAATKYLVIVPTADGPIAHLLLASREQAAEMDANTEEVTSMLRGLTPVVGAGGAEWDTALSGYGADARAEARVYTFDL